VFSDEGKLLRDSDGEIVYTRKFKHAKSRGVTTAEVENAVNKALAGSKTELTQASIKQTVQEVLDARLRPIEDKLKPKEVTAEEVSKIIDAKIDDLKEKPLTKAEVTEIVVSSIKEAGGSKEQGRFLQRNDK
jgi:hypothetical protein